MDSHESSIVRVLILCAGVFRHRAEVLSLLTNMWKMNLFGIYTLVLYFVVRIDTDPYAVYTSL